VRILVLGGTAFVGRAFVEAAAAARHEVTLFNRGETAPGLFDDLEHVRGDRQVDLRVLAGRPFDAVYDSSGYRPEAVARAVAALDFDRYVFVSTISVYADFSVAGRDESAPLRDRGDDYGALKVACERQLPAGALIIRPGIVAGPHDTSDRFPHWVRARAAGGTFEAPEPRDGGVQLIDAADLAAFTLAQLERGATGPYNVAGETTTFAAMLDACPGDGEPVWVPGDERFPLWIPPGYDGASRVGVERALEAGLQRRPLAATARATLEWLREARRLS
jgi:2'-hydroxyisoflavone reductase